MLPKLNQSGKFIENNFPNNKIPFPKQGDITDENETNENLVINITSNEEDEGVLKDNSGNTNLGFAISDYKPDFNNESLTPIRKKTINKIKTSIKNGAF